MKEIDMVYSVRRFLKTKSIPVWMNIPFMSRCVDLIYINENKEIIAVEFKKHDWRRGIKQAKDHLLGADKVYLCLPSRKISPALKEDLNQTGVGLFLYYENSKNILEEVIPPKKSRIIWNVSRDWLKKSIGLIN